MEINDITREIVDSAIKVHSALGPGLLESPYRRVSSTSFESAVSRFSPKLRYQSSTTA